MKVFQELAFYSHTTFKAHLLGILGQHIIDITVKNHKIHIYGFGHPFFNCDKNVKPFENVYNEFTVFTENLFKIHENFNNMQNRKNTLNII